MALEGLHHVTTVPADAPRNVDSYARRLGLRLVKKTVFEVASRDIGFAVDEPPRTLGAERKLPPQHEAHRARLERALTPITNPRAAA